MQLSVQHINEEIISAAVQPLEKCKIPGAENITAEILKADTRISARAPETNRQLGIGVC